MDKTRLNAPIVTGISPHQGTPGTQVTIRGERLGEDPSDLVALIICGTDCLATAKWKSSSKIVARLGQAKRGPGDIVIVTRSGGRGNSNVQFRVFIEQIGPLQESIVWVDESKTVPGRNAIRSNLPETLESEDALGLKLDMQKKLDHAILGKIFPEGSGNLRMENFNPAWYLLENHKFTSLSDLRAGLKNLQRNVKIDEESSKNVHKANLYSLISCVDTLSTLQSKFREDFSEQEKSWPVTKSLAGKIDLARSTADKLFRDVLSRKDYADSTRNALSVLTRFRFIFFLAESIDENMAKSDYSAILNDYTRAKALFKDSEVELFKKVMVVLEEKIDYLRQSIRHKLMDLTTPFEEQSKMIKYLRILDPNSDPAWDCVMAYHCWLENIFWQLQQKYFQIALQEEQFKEQTPDSISSNGTVVDVAATNNYRQAFVADLLTILTDKLQSFWRLSQNFFSGQSQNSDENYQDKRNDIDQMLTNSINVSSWLLLNLLVPSSLPEAVAKQYQDQFVSWPKMSQEVQFALLLPSLKSLRVSIKTLLDSQFTRTHLQPLIELCTTVRLKCLGILIERSSDNILSLGTRENWKLDMVAVPLRTALPDLYETEVNEILGAVRQILSFDNFPGELDLFLKERLRQMIIDLFVILLMSMKDCYDQLLQLKPDQKRPNRLAVPEGIGEEVTKHQKAPSAETTSKKLLISLTNIDYVLNTSLVAICRRLSDNGVKFTDAILKKSRQKLVAYRQSLIAHYVGLKSATVVSILDPAATNYTHLPETDDISNHVKELIMCVVFVQAELSLVSPQFTNQILSAIVEESFNRIVQTLPPIDSLSSDDQFSSQVIIDLTAFEETFQCFVTQKMSSTLNSIRARLMDKLDQESFRLSMQSFRTNLRMAITSLRVGDQGPGTEKERDDRQSLGTPTTGRESNSNFSDI